MSSHKAEAKQKIVASLLEFDQRQKGVKTDWLLQQLNKLGYTVQLEPLAAPA